MYYTYILLSKKASRHYYGHTSDIELRLTTHNAGKVRSTKAYRPWEILYTEMFSTKSEAYRRETFFKSIDGYNFLKSQNII